VSLLSFIVHLRRFENNSMDNNEQPNGLSHKKKRPRVKEFQADLKREKAKNGAPPPPPRSSQRKRTRWQNAPSRTTAKDRVRPAILKAMTRSTRRDLESSWSRRPLVRMFVMGL
jgi:hypothetical protein